MKMEQIKTNQRLSLIAQRILALSKHAQEQFLSEIKVRFDLKKLRLLKTNIKQQERIKALMSNPKKLPLGNAQLLFWTMELTSGHSKNEVTSYFIEGELDKKKLEEAINHVANEFDIFHFKVNNWLPYATRLSEQKIKLEEIHLDASKPIEDQLNAINRKLADIDLRKLSQNIYPCLIQIKEHKMLLQLVVTHKVIDTKTKLLLWHLIWQAYHGIAHQEYYPYRDYLSSEKGYYANIDALLQDHIEADYGKYNLCQIKPDILDKQTSVKKRLLYSLDKQQLDRLKEFAYSYEYTLNELIMSATLKAFKPYCENHDFLIQLISQPLFNHQYQNIVGPCLNERAFALKSPTDNLIEITQALSKANQTSLNYSNLPYGAALGWLYYSKYKQTAPLISMLIRALTRLSKYTRINKAMANCYAGLVCYEFFANRNKIFPLLSFNFRNALTDKKIQHDFGAQKPRLKPYVYPLYRNTENYVSINVDDADRNGIVIHMESYFKEDIDKKIMTATIDNLLSYLTLK